MAGGALGAVYTLACRARHSGRTEDYRAFLTALDRLPAEAVDPAYRQERRAWAQWHLGRRAEAVAALEDLVGHEPTTRRFSLLFRCQRRRGPWRAAARTLRAWFRFEFEAVRRGREWDEPSWAARP